MFVIVSSGAQDIVGSTADFISGFAIQQSLDFLALTETWITPDNTSTPAALSSAFSFSHTPRPTGRGGGTGLLISPEWIFSPYPIPCPPPLSFEFHAVTITHPVQLNIVVLYRPPGSLGHFLEELDIVLSNFPENGPQLILLGDFNIPTEKSSDLLLLLASFALTLNPSPPTHKAGNHLDYIFNRNCTTTNLTVTPLHVSDHYFVSYSLPLSPTNNPAPSINSIPVRRNIRSLSPPALASSVISALPATDSFALLHPNVAAETLLTTLSSSLDSLCPLKTRRAGRSPPAPWLTEPVRATRATLRASERKWRKYKQPDDLHAFQLLLSSFSASVFAAKSAFYQSRIESSFSNPKKLFSIFTNLLKPPSPPPPSTLLPGDFVSYFTRKIDDIRSSFSNPPPSSCIAQTSPQSPSLPCFTPLSPNKVLTLVTSARPTTCPLDPIPSHILQSIAPDLLPFLTCLINNALLSGCFPNTLKEARVNPLMKKPTLNPSEENNYKPVSLLPFLSKTIERAIFNQLSSYLHSNNLLDPHQSGFKAGHSTETALLAVAEQLHTARAASLSSVLILLDLSAAFNTVNHQILIAALQELGVTGSALSLLSSYLDGRTYRVTWGGSVSEPCPLTTGVPQGSILGPLFFSIYTNSLGSVIRSHGFSYHSCADDTQLILSFPDSDTQVAARISACLTDISQWMTAHHLKINPDKTELLYFPGKTSPTQDLTVNFGDSVLTPTQSARNLGLTLDSQLSLTANIAATTRSCRYTLYNIRRIRPLLTQKAAQVLIQALVISRLDYCNSLLAGLLGTAIRPLQLIQNAAARLVFNLPKYSHHTTPLLRSLHWLPVAARIQFKTLVLTYHAVNGSGPVYIQDMVKPYIPTRTLRSASAKRLVPPSLREKHSTRLRLFAVLAPRWWNELSDDIRTAESLYIFRRKLKTHLFRLYLD
ncbi:LOW QUALITY PROTEIN: uncharacterized protein LOC134132996 [Pungitius pungitius]|uniref:LOW QUALITY PROTEIN: uncharacterized protein LOC134132996 n=1 Tax=Pungitius pungitius TaxID=134920 RepID=UPI002E1134D4